MDLALFVALVSESTDARHLREIGLLVCGLGAVAVLVGGILGFLSIRSRTAGPGASQEATPNYRFAQERIAYIVAGLLIGAGFAIQILAARTK